MALNTMKKVVLTGLGLALTTRSRMKAMAKERSKRREMNETEGRKFITDVVFRKYDFAKKILENKIREGIEEYMATADVASQNELDDLKEEIRKMKKSLQKMASANASANESPSDKKGN
ncbi:MAG: hypothetical protein JW976_08455 [Syntrophaceae bacterium]|nr:hypothetical protein [Syntrophaceae bacterium]